MQLLQEEAKRYRCDTLGISEIRRTKAEEMDGRILWSGGEPKHEAGVLLSNRAREVLMVGLNRVQNFAEVPSI